MVGDNVRRFPLGSYPEPQKKASDACSGTFRPGEPTNSRAILLAGRVLLKGLPLAATKALSRLWLWKQIYIIFLAQFDAEFHAEPGSENEVCGGPAFAE